MEKMPLGKCGMTCAICPRHFTNGGSRCPGCGRGSIFSPLCKMFECSTKKGLNGCWECDECPCERMPRKQEFKGIYSNRIWIRSCAEISEQGFEKWQADYQEKAEMFEYALKRYDYGRLKTFFCNIFMNNDLPTLKRVLEEGEKIPYVSPVETGPLFREAVERMQGVELGTPKE